VSQAPRSRGKGPYFVPAGQASETAPPSPIGRAKGPGLVGLGTGVGNENQMRTEPRRGKGVTHSPELGPTGLLALVGWELITDHGCGDDRVRKPSDSSRAGHAAEDSASQ
jgi:hypothetical protein